MPRPVIQVENISKLYHIGLARQRSDSLKSLLTDTLHGLGRNFTWRSKQKASELWALKDISFEVLQGEVLGIIGRNGAGKSTLLKILSRITEPTSGKAVVDGRVGSLLEVGIGFHPELTGRENIFLNGAILGMRRQEIEHKFDEIVSFAEIEPFLDTPVKRYSSGMYVRLAFAIAAYLEPEILLVDEVLAVGDVAFQQKCLGKMGDVAKGGRTVLFVSHNMAAMHSLCNRVILLENGLIAYTGLTDPAIQKYLTTVMHQESQRSFREAIQSLPADPIFRLIDIKLIQNSSSSNSFITSDAIRVVFEYEVIQPVYGLRVGFDLRNSMTGSIVFRSFYDDASVNHQQIRAGLYRSTATIQSNLLNSTTYELWPAIGIHNVRWIIYDQINLSFNVVNVSGVNTLYAEQRPGVIMPKLDWINDYMGE